LKCDKYELLHHIKYWFILNDSWRNQEEVIPNCEETASHTPSITPRRKYVAFIVSHKIMIYIKLRVASHARPLCPVWGNHIKKLNNIISWKNRTVSIFLRTYTTVSTPPCTKQIHNMTNSYTKSNNIKYTMWKKKTEALFNSQDSQNVWPCIIQDWSDKGIMLSWLAQ
jgi:hypothetical protein